MKQSVRTAIVLFLMCPVLIAAGALAADTQQISALHARAQQGGVPLTANDQQVLDRFLGQAVEEMLAAANVSEAVAARSQIVRFRGWDPAMAQYTEAYVQTAKKYLQAAFDELQNWQGDQSRVAAHRNLMILVGQLAHMELADFATSQLDHPNSTIRYWAVKALANPHVAQYLTSEVTGDADEAREVLAALSERMQHEKFPEIQDLIVRFAAMFRQPEALDLIVKVADERIAAYESWQVEYESMETDVLAALATAIQRTSMPQKGQLAAKFAQLYSYVIQRYIVGTDFLPERSKQQLASVIAEVENTILPELTGQRSTGLMRALERTSNRIETLQQEHDALLGTASRAGQLAGAIRFSYPENPNTAPKKLTPPEKPNP